MDTQGDVSDVGRWKGMLEREGMAKIREGGI